MSTKQGSEGAAGARLGQAISRKPVTARYCTEWGEGAITVCEGRLIGVDVPGDCPETLQGLQAGEPAISELAGDDQAALRRWTAELEAYFRGERLCWTAEEIGLDQLGVPEFAQKVYAALLDVPAAETVSYGGLADLAGYPRAARAVGSAMANNPIPIVIPCHRVIRSDGSYGNYGRDPGYKVLLLEHEKAHAKPGRART